MVKCRYCDKDPRIKTICGSCMHFYKEDRYGNALVLLGVVAGFVVLVALALLFVLPTTVKVDCAAGQWRELPDGLEWAGGIKMAPDLSHCSLSIEGPTFAVGRILMSLS